MLNSTLYSKLEQRIRTITQRLSVFISEILDPKNAEVVQRSPSFLSVAKVIDRHNFSFGFPLGERRLRNRLRSPFNTTVARTGLVVEKNYIMGIRHIDTRFVEGVLDAGHHPVRYLENVRL